MNDRRLDAYEELAGDISRVIISEEQIQARVREIAGAISSDYAGMNPLLVGVLKGVLFFMADLLRAITISTEVDFIAISSYSQDARDRGLVRLMKDLEIPIEGRHVIFVEDVVDTGLTLNYLLRTLRARGPASLDACVLFNKNRHRLIDIPLRYKGFDLPDRFVVGYGLDHREQYRNLPFVGELKAHAFQNPGEGRPAAKKDGGSK
jgi:hypoxanthine phosphoribosyltransferase